MYETTNETELRLLIRRVAAAVASATWLRRSRALKHLAQLGLGAAGQVRSGCCTRCSDCLGPGSRTSAYDPPKLTIGGLVSLVIPKLSE